MFLRRVLIAVGAHAIVASLPEPISSDDHSLLQSKVTKATKPSEVQPVIGAPSQTAAAALLQVAKPSEVQPVIGAASQTAAAVLLQVAGEGGRGPTWAEWAQTQELPDYTLDDREVPPKVDALLSKSSERPEADEAHALDHGALTPLAAMFGKMRDEKSRLALLRDGFEVWVVWMVLAFIVVHTCYTRGYVPTDPLDALPQAHPKYTLESGHFGCLADSSICCCSLLCPGIRWADTISQANLMSFWTAFALFSFLCLLNVAVSGVFAVGFFSFVLCVYFRQQLRKKLKLPSGECPSLCVDSCFVLWCSCCAIAQEAMVVRQAAQRQEEGFGKPEAGVHRFEPAPGQRMPV